MAFCKGMVSYKRTKKKHPKLRRKFKKSKSLIERAVSIPIFIKMSSKFPLLVEKSIKKAIKI